MATLLGGVEIQVQKIDGTTEKVTVRQLRIRDYHKYLDFLDHEQECAELLCGKPEGWSDTLTNESIVAICDKGADINMDFFLAWVRRRKERAASLTASTTRFAPTTPANNAEASASINGSPVQQSAAG